MSAQSAKSEVDKAISEAADEKELAALTEAMADGVKINVSDGKMVSSEITIDSPDKWMAAEEIVTEYRMVRPGGQVLVFPLKGISSKTYNYIANKTKHKNPPLMEDEPRDSRGIIVKGAPKVQRENREDKAWVEDCRQRDNMRQTLLIEAALPFDIPGKDWTDKYAWLESKLPGDIIKLSNFIVYTLLNLGAMTGEYL